MMLRQPNRVRGALRLLGAWLAILCLPAYAAAPDAPTIGAATAGDGQVSVAFTAPGNDGGTAITGYTVTSNPGGFTAGGNGFTTSPITVTGLSNGTSYTFSVTATNADGTSPASAASGSATPMGDQAITFANPGAQNFGSSPTLTASATSSLTVSFSSSTTGVCTITSGGALTFVSAGSCTIDADQAGNGSWNAAPTVSRTFTVNAIVPGAPTIGTATAGDTQANVSFTAPASSGGAAITGYTATANPGGHTGTSASSPITVTGLTNGVAYTFTVTATNSAGSGAASAASNSITPKAAQTITFANPGSQSYGTSPNLSILGGGANATSGLTVTFTSSTSGVCTITSGGVLTLHSAGTCTINADQSGNSSFLPATQVTRSFTVNPAVPDAPTSVVATAGDTQAGVAFAAPTEIGGSAITGYTVTVSPPDVAPVNGASSPIVVTGLTNGQPYTFTVTADNVAGTGPASSASNSITPKATQTITFNNPGAQNFGTTPTLTANSDSGLPPTFTSSTTGVCTITTVGALTFITAGTCTINADQAGNGSYLAATQVTRSFTVNAIVPGAPTAVTAVAGNTSAQVSFTAPVFGGGTAITGYTVTSSPGGITATGAASPITVNGLTHGVAYDFTVTATNSAGTGPASSASSTVTPTTTQLITFNNPGAQNFSTTPTLTASSDSGLPPTFTSATPGVCSITPGGALTFITTGTCTINADQPGDSVYFPAAQVSQSFTVNAIAPGAPTAVTATAGNTSAQVGFTAPVFSGGVAITGYTVTANPGGITATGTGSPITVNGLTQGVAYSFTVTATNSAGTGPASSASSTVTPTTTQLITFNNPGAQDFNTSPTLTATANSGLAPLFSSATPGVCSITPGGVLTFITAGTCTINADQPGDSVYLPAAQVSQSFTVNAAGAVPLAPSQTLSVIAGQALDVDLTQNASGGPFSAAAVVSVTPASAGSVTISAGGSGYMLRFVPAATVAGSVAVSYTLSNAFDTSAPGVITFNVIVRSDPSKDAEVQGLVNAQANSSRRFASGQIGNFQQRLEALHNGNVSSFSNGFNLTSNSLRRKPGHDKPDVMQQWLQVKNANDKEQAALRVQAADEQPPALNNQPGAASASPLAIWTAGTISVGDDAHDSSSEDQDFVTSGLSAGVDYRWSPQLTLGLGFGYGHDKTDIGDNGSRSEADSYSLALYGSYRPLEDIYLDAVLGYQRLSFDLRRYITDSGGRAQGDRDGNQLFASLAAGYEYRQDLWLLNPYLRLDVADARLDSYEESGDSLHALNYGQQTVKTSSSSLGLRSEYELTTALGELTPSLRLEYQHDFQGAGDASMRYADLSGGHQYHTNLDALGQDRGLLGLGLGLHTEADWSLRLEYQITASSGDQQAQSLLFNLEKPF